MTDVKVRFAPSPTGLIHLGNVRGALVNWLFARRHGGRMLLRLDDTDRARSTEGFARAIEADLRWLGLNWDELARQSDRLARYATAAAALRAAGRLYPCYETEEELGLRRLRAAGGGPQPYDRAALRLDEAGRRALEAQGRRPHWRFLLEAGEVAWTDGIRGPVSFEGALLSDPVLLRADGSPTYTLASVVDDIDFAITHVIRGEDHVANTAVQIQLFRALGAAVAPAFVHFPLLTDAGGHNLSKRLGSLSVSVLRDEEGLEPMAINALLARLGTSDPVEPVASLDALVAGFDLSRFGRASPKLDVEELRRLNAPLVHAMPFEAAAPRLAALGLGGIDAAFWEAIRANLSRLADARDWWTICREALAPAGDERDFLAAAADLLPPEPWDARSWGTWTAAVSAASGRKGRALFMPLRLALTGREHGPELKTLLPILGRARAEARLRGIPA